MNSIFQEIEKLRSQSFINTIEALSNRYMIVYQNSDRSKTAFCFSVPIRQLKTNSLIDLHFQHNKYGSAFVGSEAKITIAEKASLINQHGQCDIVFQGSIFKKTAGTVYLHDGNGYMEVRPTLNGLMVVMDYAAAQSQPRLMLCLDRAFEEAYTNGKCFCIMRDQFIPFITVSCIGVINAHEQVTAPCEVRAERLGDSEYVLTFSAARKTKSRIAIEINMQETKLFQDTTVESQHPQLNNAFGGISFLGESKHVGEQWLYSRLEISNISPLQGKRILKTVLHIPQLGRYITPLTVNQISTRFCSFGSNWQNKITITDPVAESSISNGYHHLDMTKLLGNLGKKSVNFVIRGKSTNDPAIIPTGDSFYAPQILEIKFQ